MFVRVVKRGVHILCKGVGGVGGSDEVCEDTK